MASKPKRIIYWIGGYLSKAERENEWISYGAKIQEHYTRQGGADSGYAFEWISRCTAKQFAEIWSDPNTYGIFWYSHGEAVSGTEFTGYPLAYDIHIDEGWRGQPTGKRWDSMRLDPEQLPKPSPNLHFLAIKSCGSAELQDEWQGKAPGVTIVTHRGQLFRRESSKYGTFDQMLNWVTSKPGIFSKGKPSDGAGHLFELLPKPQDVGGCTCNIGVRAYWTRTQGSSVEPSLPLVTSRQFAVAPGRTPTNPLGQMWQQGIGGAPSPRTAWRPLSATTPRNPLRQMWEQGIAQKGRLSSAATRLTGPGMAPLRPILRTGDQMGGTFPTFSKITTWRPQAAAQARNPLRDMWERGTRSAQLGWRPNQTLASNPLRQMWEQGLRSGAQFRTPAQWRPNQTLAAGRNPLRQMWQAGLRRG
jgi:hypothetical protein